MGEKVFAFNEAVFRSVPGAERERFRAALVAFHQGRSDMPGREAAIGRGTVQTFAFANGSAAVFRSYRRGGWMQKVLTRDFFRFSRAEAYRPLAEFQVLNALRHAGVRVPEPLAAFIEKRLRGFAYRGSIAVKQIERSTNLLALILKRQEPGGEGLLAEYCYLAGVEAGKMLRAGVFHSDLHLGNVLVAEGTQVWLIDFDKAEAVERTAFDTAAAKLYARWCRSTAKHGVSREADDPFRRGLSLPEEVR